MVLIVDDLEDNRELYRYALERCGFVVETAENGVAAVELAERIRPSVIIMDLAMPVMDGWEATRRIRALPSLAETSIIALTAYTDSKSRSAALEAGCDECLGKPYSGSDLAERVKQILGAAQRLASGGSR